MRYLIEAETEHEKELIKNEADRIQTVHDIGWAVRMMQSRQKVARKGWNGEGQYILLHYVADTSVMSENYVAIRTVDKRFAPWTCSQADLLAEDWEVVE